MTRSKIGFKPSYPAGYFSKEAKAERASDRAWRKLDRENKKIERERVKADKALLKKELEVLNFMLKNDVIYYHHNQQESMIPSIKKVIEILKSKDLTDIKKYHPYIWNHQGEGNNYMLRSQLDNIFSSGEFKSIHDVPLDGTYKFTIKDSGQRGLGSFDYMYAEPVEAEVKVPYVNPGGFPPISY